MFPSPLLPSATVGGCPVVALVGVGEALAPPPPLLQAAAVRAMSGSVAVLARRRVVLLRFMVAPW
jgi:hypothetical protein